jgi:GntR family transcriptional regulator
MLISLKLDSETPLYEQLRNEIVLGIAKGTLKPDEKLPTVRQLAEELGINTMTVNKAYALLKQENYIVIDRRHGAKVNAILFEPINDAQASVQLEQKLELMIAEATLEGIAIDTFQGLCTNIFARMNIQKA